ncbi:DNA primase large subunit-like [Vespa crabro]|uniref:DNA primase large subunit-like n=1 Tax=Vespa crabro TaxID=7445 RepID=UPI001F014945|nr:DNA primase large subunit-like [Vespa crabro]
MFACHNSDTSINPTESYLHDLQLYKYYPVGNFSLKELESICMQRIEVLLFVERIYIGTGIRRTAQQCKEILINELKKKGYDIFVKIINGPRKELGSDVKVMNEILYLRKQDHISHFMLRGVFSIYERKWFHIQELRLFYWRLYTSTNEEIKEFFNVNKLKTHNISEEDKEELQEYIQLNNLHNEPFYKVPFTFVIDLVETHKVFLKYGMAFVPEKELAGLCFGYFKENLAEGLESMPLVANDAVNDPRINKIFNMLTEYINKEKDIIKKNYVPSLSELDDMSKKSYPLCMRIIHEMLRKDHHLKYGERKQYSLFLKDIGVTSDDAMELWKQEFTKKINEATFEREYGYRLRHIYGEGNIRKTYTCLKCSSIINLNIKSTESYGCPFKHLTNASLTQKLNEYEFVLEDIEDIVKLSSMKNYEGACKRYHEITHNCNIYGTFNSPVNYFFGSRMKL